jgi:hypothetical protein
METATLTKNEEAHVERMADSFAEPTMSERFNEWASRTIGEAKREEKKVEGKHRPREVELEDRSDEEKKFIKAVGEKDESEKAPAKSAAEKDAAKPAGSEKPPAKAGEKSVASESDDSPGEPLSGDLAERHWQGKLQGPEIEKHISQVNSRAGIILKHISQHPQKAQIEQGFRALMAGKSSGLDKPSFFRDLSIALAEVNSPAEVFHHITMQPEDREVIRNCKNPKELRAAIQTVAKHYPGKAKEKVPEPKPRAPKPPSEVGGRGAAGDDGTRGDGDFTSFSQKMDQRYTR